MVRIMASKKFIAAMAGLIVLVMLIGYGVYQFRGAREEMRVTPLEKESAYPVGVGKAVRGNLEELFFIAGTIVPRTRVEVFSRVTGHLQEVRVKEGDEVRKGDLLAVVRGNDGESVSIRSPIAGIVEQLSCQSGNIAIAVDRTGTKPLLAIVDAEVVKVQMGVHEAILSAFRVGQEARVRVGAYPLAVFKSRIASISPILHEGSRTARAEVSIANRDHRLKPGMFAMVGLVTEKLEKILLVPKESVVPGDETNLVYVIRDNIAHELEVKIGASDGQWVQIMEQATLGTSQVGANPFETGIWEKARVKEGEDVVTTGARMIYDGQKVRIIRRR
jgi:multidrug efflux pump subunit AcrA (membrane-fusion protein)